MLELLRRVALAFDGVSKVNEFRFEHREGVPDPSREFLRRVPPFVSERAKQELDLRAADCETDMFLHIGKDE